MHLAVWTEYNGGISTGTVSHCSTDGSCQDFWHFDHHPAFLLLASSRLCVSLYQIHLCKELN